MKTSKFSFLKAFFVIAVVMTANFSFAGSGNTDKNKDSKKLSEVNQNHGVYVFVQSRPIQEYDILGTVEKRGLTWFGSAREMFNTIIRRAKRDYPECEGVIFDNLELNHATCIKFRQ
jgi:hypothetical protein